MRHGLALLVGLALLWLVLSGHYDPLTLSLGGVSCVFAAGLCARMGLTNEEAVPIGLLPRLPFYTLWLLWRMVLSNLNVTWRLLAPARFRSTCLVEMTTDQQTDLGRAIFANSVTLTPGTATIALENGCAVIHSLTPLTRQQLAEGGINRRALWLEGAKRG